MWGEIRWPWPKGRLPAPVYGFALMAWFIPAILPPAGRAHIPPSPAAMTAAPFLLPVLALDDLEQYLAQDAPTEDERERSLAVAGLRGRYEAEPASERDRQGWLSAGLQQEEFAKAKTPQQPSNPVSIAKVHGLVSQFADLGYTLERVREEGGLVPRYSLVRLPHELLGLDVPEIRKRVFLTLVLPLVLQENERILEQRQRLAIFRDRLAEQGSLAPEERQWVRELGIRYRLAEDDIDELLKRVDVIPPSLALAQAAVETGWGTSQVAQRGHALFGQMRQGSRPGEWVIRTFGDLPAAVAAYAANLNTHWAYQRFREQRAGMRKESQHPDGYRLALMIDLYSEKRIDYIREVRSVIRHNRLNDLDAARLDDRLVALPLI